MKKKFYSAFSYILIIFLMINIAINIIAPEKSVDYLGYNTHRVLSPSMEPTIMVNDIVVITKASENSLEVGDIITFSVYIPELGTESYVTHYIADIQENEFGETIYKTQGEGQADGDYDVWKNEANEVVDITFEDIEGEYLFKITSIGYIMGYLQNPYILVFVIVNVIFIWVTISYIKNNRKKLKEEFDEHEITEDDYID